MLSYSNTIVRLLLNGRKGKCLHLLFLLTPLKYFTIYFTVIAALFMDIIVCLSYFNKKYMSCINFLMQLWTILYYTVITIFIIRQKIFLHLINRKVIKEQSFVILANKKGIVILIVELYALKLLQKIVNNEGM